MNSPQSAPQSLAHKPEDDTTKEMSISDGDGKHMDASTPAFWKTRKNRHGRKRVECFLEQTTSHTDGVRVGMGANASDTSVSNYWDKEDSDGSSREEADKLSIFVSGRQGIDNHNRGGGQAQEAYMQNSAGGEINNTIIRYRNLEPAALPAQAADTAENRRGRTGHGTVQLLCGGQLKRLRGQSAKRIRPRRVPDKAGGHHVPGH